MYGYSNLVNLTPLSEVDSLPPPATFRSIAQVGVVDVADEDVVKKGRLMPGNIFLVDFDEHRVVEDKEVGPLEG